MGNSLFNNRSKYEATNIDEVREKLKQYGICYIPDVLSEEECVQMISGTWDFFEHITQKDITPIKRHRPDSWTNLSTLCPLADMLYHYWNAGHSQHLWDIRENEKILKIFSLLWNCEPKDLLVSFDGFGFLPPPEVTDIGFAQANTKQYHLDQSLVRPYFDGIQSFVTAYDINENDATLSFYESSHLIIPEFIETFGIRTDSDWVKFNNEEINFFANKCKEEQIKCSAGSLVLWDSRTVHTPMKPIRGREISNTRCISYLSYSKKDRISEEKLMEKIEAFENMQTSNHYAHNPSYFNNVPHNHDKLENYITPINFPVLSSIGYSLVGYDDEEIKKFMEENEIN